MPKHNPTEKNRRFGVVTRYNEEKGFGFIAVCTKIPKATLEAQYSSDHNTESFFDKRFILREFEDRSVPNIFVHATSAEEKLFVGQWLTFEIRPDKKQVDKFRALNVRSLKNEAARWTDGSSMPPAFVVSSLLDLWLECKATFFDFNQFCSLVYTLRPEDQINFVRKSVAENTSDTSLLSNLNSLIRFSRAEAVELGIRIDYNLDLIISVLVAIKEGLYPKPDLIAEMMFNYIDEELEELPHLNHSLFNMCPGRTVQIRKEIGEQINVYASGRLGEVSSANDILTVGDVEYLIENDTIVIDGKTVALDYVSETVYEYNLAKLPKKDDGLIFCEGRVSPKLNSVGKKLWWCRNTRCYAACQETRSSIDWQKFTLADIIVGLGLSFDEEAYYKFIGVLNRVEQLKSHLKCRHCSRILRPARQASFSFYRTNWFHCTNSECSERENRIYLSSCSNHKCLTVIDSRDSVRCNYASKGHPQRNGMYICKKCGGCCSKYQLEQQLLRFKQILTESQYSSDLVVSRSRYNLDKGLYHLENEEFQCYRCNTVMHPAYGPGTALRCGKCFVQYPKEYLPEPWKQHAKRNIESEK